MATLIERYPALALGALVGAALLLITYVRGRSATDPQTASPATVDSNTPGIAYVSSEMLSDALRIQRESIIREVEAQQLTGGRY